MSTLKLPFIIEATLYLVPCTISDDSLDVIPESTISVLHSIKHFIAERARTARRFIKSTTPPYTIDELSIVEFDRDHDAIKEALKWLANGHPVGVISESGIPGIADPGSEIVREAHKKGIKVVPLTGPNSILLALSASGLNGQSFAFNGYLSIKDHELINDIKKYESRVFKENQTQIFIETPYRNDRLLKNLVKHLSPDLKLCIAKDLTGPQEIVKTRPIRKWATMPEFEIGKYPTIFLIGK